MSVAAAGAGQGPAAGVAAQLRLEVATYSPTYLTAKSIAHKATPFLLIQNRVDTHSKKAPLGNAIVNAGWLYGTVTDS